MNQASPRVRGRRGRADSSGVVSEREETPKVVRNRRLRPLPSVAADEESAAPRPPLSARLRAGARAAWLRLRRPVLFFGRGVLAVALVIGAIEAFKAADRYLHTSPSFAIRQIEVQGASRLSEEDVLVTAQLAIGQNVFSSTPAEVRARLLGQPWVAEAEATRRLPGRWILAIREREPLAVLADDGGWLVSREGEVFKRIEAGDPVDLPVITGIEHDRFVEDLTYRASTLSSTVELLDAWRSAGLYRREPIEELEVLPQGGLLVRMGEDLVEVRLGEGAFAPKLDRLRRVLSELEGRHSRPAYVHLDNVRTPERVIVRVR